MYEFLFNTFGMPQLMVLALCAVLAGVNKTGLPGIGILCVPVMAMTFDAKISTGLLLPLLALADLFAVAYYRRHAHWRIVFRLLPWTLAGLVAGSLVIRHVSDIQLKPLIGFIALFMLIINFLWQRRRKKDAPVPHNVAFAAAMGFAAGLTSQLANASGPIMVIYLLAMRLPKEEYIGTSAWYFLILNWLKLPLFVWDGRIGMEVVRADLAMLPFIACGAALGIFALKKIPQRHFNLIIQLLALAATLKLCSSVSELF